MAKYTASPWGNVRGKIGGSVGGDWKGISWVRERILPRQVGTKAKLFASKGGCVRGVIFSAPQMNIRRSVFTMLGGLGRKTLTTLMRPVWQSYCTNKNLKMTGTNLFMSKNVRRLYDTINRNLIPGSTNQPDWTQMRVSFGDLEASQSVTGATYASATGIVTITWDTNTYTNGSPDDDAFVAVYQAPTSSEYGDYLPIGELFVANTGQKRSAGSATISVPPGKPWLIPLGQLFAFVFFSDACANYSPSVGKVCS
jgi:hypothetical protein